MAKYTTIKKITFELGVNSEALLDDVSDDKLSEIIEQQSRVIDDFLQNTKNIPWDDVEAPDSNLPLIIQELCITFVKYKIYMRASFKDVPDFIQKEYNNAINLIEKIQSGKITIGPKETYTQPDSGGAVDQLRWQSQPKVF